MGFSIFVNWGSNIYKMNLFENTLKLNGFPISKAKSLLKEIQQIPENKYENYIINAREKIVTYHIQNNL